MIEENPLMQLDAARKQVTQLTTERNMLRGQITQLTTDRDALQTKLNEALAQGIRTAIEPANPNAKLTLTEQILAANGTMNQLPRI